MGPDADLSLSVARQGKLNMELASLEAQARADAAFDSAMAEINRLADEGDEDLR